MRNLTSYDLLHLGALKADLRHLYRLRQAMGWKTSEMEESQDRSHSMLSKFLLSENKYAWDWRWSTFAALTGALGVKPGVEVSGFELPDTPLLLMGLNNPAFLAVGVIESMARIRNEAGISGAAMGTAIGFSVTWTEKADRSDNPKLPTLMHYARGLGGTLRFTFREN